MDDFQLIEIIEAVRDRLREDLHNLEELLARVILTDYRTASASTLQECLVEVTCGLDNRKPADCRLITRMIALAESNTVAIGATTVRRAASLVVNEPASLDAAQLEQSSLLSQGLRYLSLPASKAESANVSSREPQVIAISDVRIPTRFGVELSRCVSLRQAVACVRKRIPNLKGLVAYEFLGAIGYPVAIPAADALRFARQVGMIPSEEKGAAENYITMAERAARLTGTSVAQIGYLVQLYAGGHKLQGFDSTCAPKNPRCGACRLTGRCSRYPVITAAATAAAGQPQRGRPIHEWSADERPRERLLAGERLSNSELLAIILRTGSGRLSAVELARELLHTFGTLHDLEKASPQDIVTRMKGKGIGPAKAVEICAAIEIGRRITQPAADTRLGLKQVGTSRDIFEMCRARYKAAAQEEFLLIILNTKNRVQKEVPVSLGTLNSSIVHPRDVFRHALREAAAAVIFVHNHPSGDPSPSEEDILLTSRLVDAGKLLGIQVLDHVIIGSHEWYSFADHGRLR